MAKKYASQVASQRCYAGRHGYRIFAQWLDDAKPAAQTAKPAAILARLRDESCRWVIYFDADVYLVNHERPLSEWLDDASELVMTDHHQIMNNGAIFVRRTPRMLEFLLPLWIKLTMAYTWSYTDNGSLMEVIARGYALGLGGETSCPRRPANVAFPCYQSVFTKAFGPVPGRGGSRGRAGLKLVAPADGFNNHGCMSPVVDCSSPVARKLMASRYQREWTLDDVFVPPKIRKRQGLPPMFGLHSKASNPFPDRAMRSILQPANVTCADLVSLAPLPANVTRAPVSRRSEGATRPPRPVWCFVQTTTRNTSQNARSLTICAPRHTALQVREPEGGARHEHRPQSTLSMMERARVARRTAAIVSWCREV